MTETDRRILLEADRRPVERAAVAAELGLSSPAFHQRLLHLLDRREALAEFPEIVNRHRRMRDNRRIRRTQHAS
jgi:hypothetical protein